MAAVAVATAAVALGATACGGGDDAGGGTTAAGTTTAGKTGASTAASSGTAARPTQRSENIPFGTGQCVVLVSGDATVKANAAGGPTAFGSDYYSSDAEMRRSLEQLEKFANPSASADEIKRKVDDAMAADPRLFIFIVNCVNGSEFSISFLPGEGSKYADFPMKPGSYAIPAGSALGAGAGKGEVAVLMTLGKDEFYRVSTPGQFEIVQWDERGISGSFAFGATQTQSPSKVIEVSGSFLFPCTSGDRCKK